MEKMEILGPERQKKVVDWRCLFTPEQLKQAADKAWVRNVKAGTNQIYYRTFSVVPGPASVADRGRNVRVSIQGYPRNQQDQWNTEMFICACAEGRKKGHVCFHEAAAMLAWEKELGEPFFVQESDWTYRARLEREKQYQEEMEYRRGLAEATREFFPVSKILNMNRPKRLVLYDLNKASEGFVTSAWAAHEAQRIGSGKAQVKEIENRDGQKYLSGEYSGWNERIRVQERALMLMQGNRFLTNQCNCACHELEGWPEKGMCPHQLLILQAIRNVADKLSNEDLTDESARQFFAWLQRAEKREEKNAFSKEAERVRDVLLAPRIIVEEGIAQVSFKVGMRGGKMLVLRNLRDLLRAWQQRKTMELSKTEKVDFSQHDFAPEAGPWLIFIQRRVTELDEVNERLYAKANPWRRPVTLTVTAQQPLSGAVLDQFYELAEG